MMWIVKLAGGWLLRRPGLWKLALAGGAAAVLVGGFWLLDVRGNRIDELQSQLVQAEADLDAERERARLAAEQAKKRLEALRTELTRQRDQEAALAAQERALRSQSDEPLPQIIQENERWIAKQFSDW